MKAWRLKIEPLRVCRPVVSDWHQIDEKQDPDPDPHQSRIRILYQSEKRDPYIHNVMQARRAAQNLNLFYMGFDIETMFENLHHLHYKWISTV
jgi:hypothetical protein